MIVRASVRTIVLAIGLLALAAPHAALAAAPIAATHPAQPVSETPAGAAAALDRAATFTKVSAGDVPALRLRGTRTQTEPAGRSPDSPNALDDWLAAGLAAARHEKTSSARAKDLRSLAASLRGIADIERLPSGRPHAEVRRVVTAVLAQPAYHPAATPPAAKPRLSWWQLLLGKFAMWWASVMGRTVLAAAGIPAIGNVLAFMFLTGAVLALAFLAYRLATIVARRRARRDGSAEAGLPLAANVDAAAAYAAASAAARAGAYARAIVLLFNAALITLDESGRVPYDAARTAGEYRRAVRRNVAAAAASFDTIARAFTFVAYAQAPAAESDWRAADDAFRSMPFGQAAPR